MKKKFIILFTISFMAIGIYFLNLSPKEDVIEIQNVVMALGHPNLTVAHIELLEKNKAVAFYEWSDEENTSFGNVIIEKDFLRWEINRGGSLYLLDNSKLNWGHLELRGNAATNADILRGKITDSEIESVQVITKDGKEYQSRVIEYNNGEKFWFLIANEELLDATVTGLSLDGDVIAETQTSY